MKKHIAASIRLLAAFALIFFGSGITFIQPEPVNALPLMNNRFDRMSSSVASASATHTIGFALTDVVTPLGSIEIEFCSNDPFPATACTAPTGFDLSGASLGSQTGNIGFAVHPSSTVNKLVLSRIPIAPIGVASTYQVNSVINPDTPGTHFVRLRTFASNNASGPATEEGGIAFTINSQVSVSSEVPPYLKFCVGITITNYDCSTATTFFMNLGEFNTSEATVASSEFVVATNAGFGLSVVYAGTTLTSGNNEIPAIVPTGVSVPGVSQFGINLRANSAPTSGSDPVGPGTATVTPAYNTPNLFRFASNDSIASTNTTSDNKKFTVSYITNINGSQSPGVYATTLSFICLANF